MKMNNIKDDEGDDVNEKQTKMKARPSLLTNTPKNNEIICLMHE
jgi:hypothetical protein